jgi:hypothetical protein
MQFNIQQNRRNGQSGVMPAGRSWRPPWGRILSCIVAIAALAGAAGPGQQQPAPGQQPGTGFNPDRPILPPVAEPVPDANAQMLMREENEKKQNFSAANIERKKQIADDSAKLLKLATDLKAEVDKTNKDTLSLNVIRKADEIERLAHSVKEKMKLTVGGS